MKPKQLQSFDFFRYFVLHHLPNLKFLDSTKVRESERIEAKRRGQFMKVVRPKVNNLPQPEILQDNSSNYSPLPSTLRKFNEHKGTSISGSYPHVRVYSWNYALPTKFYYTNEIYKITLKNNIKHTQIHKLSHAKSHTYIFLNLLYIQAVNLKIFIFMFLNQNGWNATIVLNKKLGFEKESYCLEKWTRRL